MDKRLLLQLNANRRVSGVLRGFDPFMNIVLDETVDEHTSTNMGLAVSEYYRGSLVPVPLIPSSPR